MKLADAFDNFMGAMNFYERIFGVANQAIKPSKGGRFGPMVRIRVKRIDKGGDVAFRQVVGHLHRHGVPTFHHAYDAEWRYFSVRKTQEKWAEWLYNGGNLRTPKRAWKEK